jgi:predicted RNA-binding Zn-ribbon protein involved in translation (DUF1610 family)
MDAEILATITSFASATKTTIEAIRAALAKTKANSETLALVSELQSRLLQLQEIALSLHQEKAQAIEENAQLRAEIRRNEEGAAERQKYQSKEVGCSRLLSREDQPGTYYCPTCFEVKKVAIPLQQVKQGAFGLDYRCNVCGTAFPVNRPV